MPDSLSVLLNQGSLLASAAGILVFVYFLFGFVLPARRQQAALANLSRNIREIAASNEKAIVPPQKAGALFAGNPAWAQAWQEFEKTLRLQQDIVDGENRIKSVQSTAPAATFFSRSILIDPAIEKPACGFMPTLIAVCGGLGLLSGIASILLHGGDAAPAEAEAATAAFSTEALLPIILSLVPLALAMTAAGYRKKLPESLPPLADEAIQAIDGLYKRYSADDEADASRKEAAETAQMREAFAKMLGDVLTAQISRQTASIQSSTASVAGEIAKSIALALEKPLSKIVQAAEQSAKQTENIERTLKDSMASLTRDMGQTITKTFEKPLGQMVQVVEQSGRQAENVDRVLQGTMSSMVSKIEEASREQIKGLNALLLENAKSLHDMRQNVSQMMDDLKKNTEYMSGVTRGSVEKMDLSAKTILNAAEKFGEAGQVMNAQISHAHSLSRHMMESGAALNGSSQALAATVADYGKARDSIASLIGTLQGVVKEVDQKVTINQSLVSDMQKVADRLKEIQVQTDQYLNQVSNVLSTGFSGFGKSVNENLEKSTSAFHASMSNSVELISVQMRNLTSALEELPELLRKPAA